LVNKPLGGYFKKIAITVQSKARENFPVDTGHGRNEIQYEVDDSKPPLFSRVGFLGAREASPLWFKARAMEFGTAKQGDPEVSHKSSHFPPGAALDVWARRHGKQSGRQVANIIGRRGGLKARRPLRTALKDSMGDIRKLLDDLGNEIANRWGK
jgi:hypothetical protein